MRSSNRCKDKLYTESWCISGEKLKLLENPKKCYKNKQISITSTLETQDFSFDDQKCKKNDRKINRVILQLNQKDYDSANKVLNRQLKHIYETVEIEDFKRILDSFYMSSQCRQLPRQNDDILSTIDTENIYEEFFGRYYKLLEDSPIDS